MKPTRVLIFVVAYNAERTLAAVLDRIPSALFERADLDFEVLVIDDASSDRTVAAGVHSHAFGNRRVTILRNPVNLGYGGNQKVGYHYALTRGFDIVALLHGDGQYAPEKLPALIEPLVRGEAEAVFGSRMLTPGTARAGGMPLYKFVGNQVLTALQNRIVGTRLSEYHSGYRLYACRALARLPFDANSNGFDFDTDIIIQLHRAGARIVEQAVPTFYGDEICHVNGLAYAFRILLSCLRSRLFDLGLFYHRRFDLDSGNAHYKHKLHFQSSHSLAAAQVRSGERVLDLGCGPGELAAALRAQGAQVVGVDCCITDTARAACTAVIEADLDSFDWGRVADLGPFDKVLALDIIEHLRNAETFVQQLSHLPALAGAEVIVSVPNVAFLPVRLMLLLGQFNHGKYGILDRTHTRLYTVRSLRDLLDQNGFDILGMRGVPTPFPLALGNTCLARALLRLNRVAIRLSRSLFAYQLFCRVRPRPSLEVLLMRAESEGTRARAAAKTGCTPTG